MPRVSTSMRTKVEHRAAAVKGGGNGLPKVIDASPAFRFRPESDGGTFPPDGAFLPLKWVTPEDDPSVWRKGRASERGWAW